MSSNLRLIRESIKPKVSVEALSKRTKVTSNTIYKAENGGRVSYVSAMDILKALNEVLVERGLEPVTLDQLGLNLY